MEDKNKNQLLVQALKYLEQGFSIIPVRGKTCLLKSWSEYQTRKPTREEVENWFFELNPIGIAIITGKVSGVVVLDIEKGVDTQKLDIPKTPTVKSGGNGFHFYFKYPENQEVKTANLRSSAGLDADLKSDGGYVVAPPSQHAKDGKATGKTYKWFIGLEEKMAGVPDWLLRNEGTAAKEEKTKNWEEKIKGVNEGQRNITAASLAGKLLRYFPSDEWFSLVLPTLKLWNQRNRPPLEESEIENLFKSLARKEDEKTPQESKPREKRKLWTMHEILNKPESKEPFLIEKLLPVRAITSISGHPGCGKSWIVMYFAKAIATGQYVFGKYSTLRTPILIVDEENGIDEFKRRTEMMDFAENLPIYLCSQTGFRVDNNNDMNEILGLIKENGIGLVIFDPFSAVHGRVENNAEEMAALMHDLEKIVEQGASVLFVHHHRKSTGFGSPDAGASLRGSSVLSGRLDSHIAVKKERDEGSIIELTVSHEKSRRGKKSNPFKVKLSEQGEKMIIDYKDTSISDTKKTKAKELIIKTLKNSEMTQNQIIAGIKKEIEIGGRTARQALYELEEDKMVSAKRDKKTKIYSLTKVWDEEV